MGSDTGRDPSPAQPYPLPSPRSVYSTFLISLEFVHFSHSGTTPPVQTITFSHLDDYLGPYLVRIFSKNREDHGAHTCRPALRYYLQDRNCGFGVSHFSLLLLFTSRGMKQHIRGKSGFSCSRLPLSTSYSECLLAPQQPGRSYFTCIVQAASFGQRGLTTEPPVRKGALPPPRLLL